MRTIDIHAHTVPQCFQKDVLNNRKWHNMTSAEGELFNPRVNWTPAERDIGDGLHGNGCSSCFH